MLIPVSLGVSGKDSYPQFYEHTLKVHDRTPLTSHMGLRVLVSHNVGTGPASGRIHFALVTRRMRSMSIALRLGQIFIILLSQLTCYCCSFMILAVPLTRVKKGIEAPLFGLAALSRLVGITFTFNADKYPALTLISLLFCFVLMCAFAPSGSFAQLLGPRADGAAAARGAF